MFLSNKSAPGKLNQKGSTQQQHKSPKGEGRLDKANVQRNP